jgi:GT2 family glycosyltransferase
MIRFDLVTVFHNDTNHAQHEALRDRIAKVEPDGGYRYIAVDNRTTNRGFAKACNLGAFHPEAHAPIIGFINPDVHIDGPFLDEVAATIDDLTVITGCRFNKTDRELRTWGLSNWVCGAAMFVQRRWFTATSGFDEQFVWAWEETDLIRRAEYQGLRCRPASLPIRHASPEANSDEDTRYKRTHFNRGAQRYYSKWGR